MNRYILGKRNTTIKLNTDTLDVDYVEISYDIDRMWFIEEDGVLVRKNKEYLEKERNRISKEKICDSCEPTCECVG